MLISIRAFVCIVLSMVTDCLDLILMICIFDRAEVYRFRFVVSLLLLTVYIMARLLLIRLLNL